MKRHFAFFCCTLFSLVTTPCIPKQPEVLVFDRVGFSYQCLFSLVPCPKTMVTRSKQKLARASLSNSQFFKLFGYNVTFSADSESPQKPLVLILLGPPRSGEGILAIKTSQAFSIPYISAANLLHAQMNEGTELGQQAREYINCRGAIPDSFIMKMLYDRLKFENKSPAVLLDHMPRTTEQALELKKNLGDQYRFLVISIQVPDETLLLKAEVRLICQRCGRVYHKQFSPPEKPDACDQCGATLVQREDDSSETVKKRLEDYRKSIEPILAFYRNEGTLTEVNGNCPLETTFEEIKQLFKQYACIE